MHRQNGNGETPSVPSLFGAKLAPAVVVSSGFVATLRALDECAMPGSCSHDRSVPATKSLDA